jgi:hypothetical protein
MNANMAKCNDQIVIIHKASYMAVHAEQLIHCVILVARDVLSPLQIRDPLLDIPMLLHEIRSSMHQFIHSYHKQKDTVNH